MMLSKKWAALLILLTAFIYALPSAAGGGAGINITETFRSDYFKNGSLDAAVAGDNTGAIAVNVPNSVDVLQYIRINISNESRTNISSHLDQDGKKWNFYRGTAAGTGTRLFRDGDIDTYDILPSVGGQVRPNLNVSMTVKNYAGGSDIFSHENVDDNNYNELNSSVNLLQLRLTITNPANAWKALDNVRVRVRFQKNVVGNTDIVNVTAANISSGTVTIGNSDGSDNQNDEVNTTGQTLNPGSTLTLLINLTLDTHNNTANDPATSENLNDDTTNNIGSIAVYNSTAKLGLISNITVSYNLSRGSVRQGIDLIMSSTWRVRGFMKNINSESQGENSTTYAILNWSIFQINGTGLPHQNPNISIAGNFNLSPGSTKYTNWFDTATTSKPYYTSYFDWYVNSWESGSNQYYAIINSTMDMGVLYEIDISNGKTLSGTVQPNAGEPEGMADQELTITDTVTYLGHASINATNLTVYSFVPSNGTKTDGTDTGYMHFEINCSSVAVDVESIVITNNITGGNGSIVCVNNSANNKGYLYVNITDFQRTNFGSNLSTNDVVTISYKIHTNESLEAGVDFNFTGNATLHSESGTPITELFPMRRITVSAVQLTGWKQLWVGDPTNPNVINVTINVSVIDKNGSGINDIRIMDFVPNGTNFANNTPFIDTLKINVSYITKGQRYYLANASNRNWTYNLQYNGTVILPTNTPGFAFQYFNSSNANDSRIWNGSMYDNDSLTIYYEMTINQTGTYILPATIIGVDPSTGNEVRADAMGVIQIVSSGVTEPLKTEESELSLAKVVIVGQPATWIKTFTVYNPNSRPISARFEAYVFPDATHAYASYIDPLGQKTDEKVEKDFDKVFWETKLAALETRTYDITILTPPILEVDRKVEVLEKLPDKKVKLKTDIFLKSFAKENYENVKLNMPVSYDKIIKVQDAFGNQLAFSGGADSITIDIGSIEAEGVKTVTVVYIESYPTIIVVPDKDRYKNSELVGLSILVINGGETIEHPYFETEVYDPQMESVFSSVTTGAALEPLEKTEMAERFVIPAAAPTGAYIANVRFREDFAIVAHGFGNFYVLGKRFANLRLIETFLIVMLGIFLVSLTVRRAMWVKKNW